MESPVHGKPCVLMRFVEIIISCLFFFFFFVLSSSSSFSVPEKKKRSLGLAHLIILFFLLMPQFICMLRCTRLECTAGFDRYIYIYVPMELMFPCLIVSFRLPASKIMKRKFILYVLEPSTLVVMHRRFSVVPVVYVYGLFDWMTRVGLIMDVTQYRSSF